MQREERGKHEEQEERKEREECEEHEQFDRLERLERVDSDRRFPIFFALLTAESPHFLTSDVGVDVCTCTYIWVASSSDPINSFIAFCCVPK